jgi:hypothetical protein
MGPDAEGGPDPRGRRPDGAHRPRVGDWDLAFCHEALARAHAIAGDVDAARVEVERALAVQITEEEDRALLRADLETIPGIVRFW